MTEPTLETEQQLLTEHELVIGIDEVGRGAIAGPVAVGACVIATDQLEQGAPAGVRDSKLLTAKRRLAVEPAARAWALASAVGWATAAEIDEYGIGNCLACAAIRALGELWQQGIPVDRAAILLDGSHDWLTGAVQHPIPVLLRPKADRDCASVAAASVIAKVARDRHMAELAASQPEWEVYGWQSNVGYGSAKHRAAIRQHGPSLQHRHTWLTKIN
ncbi:ribonuclease HII [uncultured Gulosibacter sp.]|uniref:ribonuclease HII n=1 Tax=uncultured Gulosibacter sp. TaxID=1339167 RepID=UPI00288ADBEF|nr:ribonuclease HII [uncultured Gulosibacter sp.]